MKATASCSTRGRLPAALSPWPFLPNSLSPVPPSTGVCPRTRRGDLRKRGVTPMAKTNDRLAQHRQRLQTILERDFGASLMNNTKWTEALARLKQFGLQHRAKLITVDEPTWWGWLSSGPEDRLPIGWVAGCVGS